MFYVYILYSPGFDKYYIGQTKNVDQRVIRHNNGMETFTKKYTPWQLIFSIMLNTRREAVQLERKLKNLSRERLKEFMIKYSSGN